MKEITVEEFLTAECVKRGGLCLKLPPASFVGLPDRLILLPGGRVAFMELKRPGKEPTRVQRHWIDHLVGLGFRANWADDKDRVDELFAVWNF